MEIEIKSNKMGFCDYFKINGVEFGKGIYGFNYEMDIRNDTEILTLFSLVGHEQETIDNLTKLNIDFAVERWITNEVIIKIKNRKEN